MARTPTRLQLEALVPQMVDSRLPILSIIKNLRLGTRVQTLARKRLYTEASAETIYGGLVQRETLVYNGHSIPIEFSDVKALMLHLSLECPGFGPFLKKYAQRDTVDGRHALRTIIYMDGVTPGNQTRPDCARTYEAIDWSVMEFPEWFRRDSRLWFTFAYVSKADLHTANCPNSVLLCFILRQLYIRSEVHVLGFHFYCGGNKEKALLRHGFYLGDDLSVFEYCSSKG